MAHKKPHTVVIKNELAKLEKLLEQSLNGMERLVAEHKIMRGALKEIMEGDVRIPSQLDKDRCVHHQFVWEACERCTDDFIKPILAQIEEIK